MPAISGVGGEQNGFAYQEFINRLQAARESAEETENQDAARRTRAEENTRVQVRDDPRQNPADRAEENRRVQANEENPANRVEETGNEPAAQKAEQRQNPDNRYQNSILQDMGVGRNINLLA